MKKLIGQFDCSVNFHVAVVGGHERDGLAFLLWVRTWTLETSIVDPFLDDLWRVITCN